MDNLEIASRKNLKITDVTKRLNLNQQDLYLYGNDITKVDLTVLDNLKDKPNGKLILVTAVTPTPFGEGKTTMSIAIADGLNKIGKKVFGALREPSMGPVLGMKGSATGGGYTQIIPRDKINLHFTGDLHAISSAHNFLSAAIDNHIYYGNELNIDVNKVVWPRTLDVNDRALRALNLKGRDDKFIITAASEIMAILALATSLDNLKIRLSKILIAYTKDGQEIYASDLKIIDMLVVLLKEALKPNLVQTLEGTPFFVHCGPFANIAHGCNSVLATKMALKLSDFVITEAGFGADLGAEKFLNIKTRILDKEPDAVVIVATIRALKYHGFGDDFKALEKGMINIVKHVENIKNFNLPYIIVINHFADDKKEEVDYLLNWAKTNNHPISFVDSYLNGSNGAIDIANKLVELTKSKSTLKNTYKLTDDLFTKVYNVATNIYGANGVTYTKKAFDKLTKLNKDYANIPICIAKTPLSFSNDPKLRALASNFDLEISDVRLSRGAGFVVLLTKGIITMPGLPKKPNAEEIFIDSNGIISGKL